MYLNIFLFSALIYLSSTSDAYAYLDPGTFTIIINATLAAFAAVAAYISLTWSTLKIFFKKIFKKKEK